MKPKLAPKKKTTVKDTLGITVKIVKENKDGSADAVVRYDKEGLETLVQWGLVALLAAAIDEYKVRPEKDGKVITKRSVSTAKKKVSKK